MIAVISLLTSLTLASFITKFGAVALTLTGLSSEEATFQARSAFSGVGFTTREAERVVDHPIRRRIIMLLMLLGNLGVAAVVTTSVLSYNETRGDNWYVNLGILLSGIMILWVFAFVRPLNQLITRLIEWILIRFGKITVHDYVSLLHLSDGFVVIEIRIGEQDWIANKTLAELRLSKEGVLVLGIHRQDGNYVGSPSGKVRILPNDVLSLYGPLERLEELDLRQATPEGDRAHRLAVAAQKAVTPQDKPDDETY